MATVAPAPIRVLCVDDIPDVTAVISMLIDGQADSGMSCVGCLASANNLVGEVRRLGEVDVVLLDATMPGTDSLHALSELAREFPNTKTIIFSGHEDDAFILRVLDAGAWGCVSKNDAPETILQAVRDVASGQTYFPQLMHPRVKTA